MNDTQRTDTTPPADMVEATKSPINREGLFAYFDQMTDANGQIVTTADWLADIGMLIKYEVEKDASKVAAESAAKWVPCSERLPENDRIVWVMERFGDADNEFAEYQSAFGYLLKGQWFIGRDSDFDESDYVRFWMESPIPSSYPKGYEASIEPYIEGEK